jgi:hypothetical protein
LSPVQRAFNSFNRRKQSPMYNIRERLTCAAPSTRAVCKAASITW